MLKYPGISSYVKGFLKYSLLLPGYLKYQGKVRKATLVPVAVLRVGIHDDSQTPPKISGIINTPISYLLMARLIFLINQKKKIHCK